MTMETSEQKGVRVGAQNNGDGRVGAQNNGDGRGPPALAISNAVVHLLRHQAGRGPTQAKTTLTHEFAVVTLRDWLTTAESTLVQSGRAELVLSARAALSENMRREAIASVEQITGREVLAFLSDHEPQSNVAVFAFVYASPATLRAA